MSASPMQIALTLIMPIRVRSGQVKLSEAVARLVARFAVRDLARALREWFFVETICTAGREVERFDFAETLAERLEINLAEAREGVLEEALVEDFAEVLAAILAETVAAALRPITAEALRTDLSEREAG